MQIIVFSKLPFNFKVAHATENIPFPETLSSFNKDNLNEEIIASNSVEGVLRGKVDRC